MKYKIYKNTTKNYQDKFTEEKEAKEINIDVGGIKIDITEHQLGMELNEPYIYINIPEQSTTYSMTFEWFIKYFLESQNKTTTKK